MSYACCAKQTKKPNKEVDAHAQLSEDVAVNSVVELHPPSPVLQTFLDNICAAVVKSFRGLLIC